MILIKTFCGAFATMVSGEGICPLWTVCVDKKGGIFFSDADV